MLGAFLKNFGEHFRNDDVFADFFFFKVSLYETIGSLFLACSFPVLVQLRIIRRDDGVRIFIGNWEFCDSSVYAGGS